MLLVAGGFGVSERDPLVAEGQTNAYPTTLPPLRYNPLPRAVPGDPKSTSSLHPPGPSVLAKVLVPCGFGVLPKSFLQESSVAKGKTI